MASASCRSRSEALALLRGENHRIENRAIAEGETKLEVDGIEGASLEILAEFAAREADAFGLKVRRGENEETLVGVDVRVGHGLYRPEQLGRHELQPRFPGASLVPADITRRTDSSSRARRCNIGRGIRRGRPGRPDRPDLSRGHKSRRQPVCDRQSAAAAIPRRLGAAAVRLVSSPDKPVQCDCTTL